MADPVSRILTVSDSYEPSSFSHPDENPAPHQGSDDHRPDSPATPDREPPAREQTLWSGRTHWKHYAGRLILWALGSIVFGAASIWVTGRFEAWGGSVAFWGTVIPIGLVGAYLGATIFWRIIGRRYRLTDQRLFIERGVLAQTIDQTELIRVDDVRVRKTLLDRVFGLGDVEINSTDASDALILLEGIRDPDRIAEDVRSRMRALRKKSLFIENL